MFCYLTIPGDGQIEIWKMTHGGGCSTQKNRHAFNYVKHLQIYIKISFRTPMNATSMHNKNLKIM